MARKVTIPLEVEDKFSAPLRKFADAAMYAEREAERLGKATDKAQRGMTSFGNVAKGVAAGLGLHLGISQVTSMMLEAGKASLQLAMNLETTKIGFTTLIGSAEGAQKHLDELRDFASRTPFTFTDLTEASKRMMALGFETEKVIPTLTILGDAAAALNSGSVGIDRMSLALGQMQAKGRLSTQEMNQLTEAGVNGWKYVAVELGVTEAALRKMTEKGLVPADVAIKAILEGMQQDFGGLMAAQAETAAGKISNLTDAFERLGTAVGEQSTPQLGFFAGGLSESINNGVALTEALNKGIITAEEYGNVQNRLATYATTTGEVQEWLKYKIDESNESFNAAIATTAIMNDMTAEAEREARRFASAQIEVAGATRDSNTALGEGQTVYSDALKGLRDFNLGEAQRLALEQAIKLASGELTQEDVERSKAIGFLTKQLELGNITQQEYIDKLNALATGATTAKDAINETAKTIASLQNRDIYIRFHQIGMGDVDPSAGDVGLPGGDSGVYNPTPSDDGMTGGPGVPGGGAAGGTFWDKPMLVGEHGPEVWTPPSAGGSFASSTQSAGGMTFGNINVDARGSTLSAREIEMAVERALETAGRRADIRGRTG